MITTSGEKIFYLLQILGLLTFDEVLRVLDRGRLWYERRPTNKRYMQLKLQPDRENLIAITVPTAFLCPQVSATAFCVY